MYNNITILAASVLHNKSSICITVYIFYQYCCTFTEVTFRILDFKAVVF